MTYTIELEETLYGTYTIEAESEAAAKAQALADLKSNAVPDGVMTDSTGYKLVDVHFTHIPAYCARPGCRNEATRWYDDDKDPAAIDGAVYVCLEHDDVAAAEESGDAMITNSEGKRVELAVYSCSEECGACND